MEWIKYSLVYTADSIRKFDSKSNRTADSIRDSIRTQKTIRRSLVITTAVAVLRTAGSTWRARVVGSRVRVLVLDNLQQTDDVRMSELRVKLDFTQRWLRQTITVTTQRHGTQRYRHSYSHSYNTTLFLSNISNRDVNRDPGTPKKLPNPG